MFSPDMFSVARLANRAIGALAKADVESLGEVLADCSQAESPVSTEEFSQAIVMHATFEKVLQQTVQTLQLLRNKEDRFRYGRNRNRNS